MARDDDLVLLGLTRETREIVLELGQRNLPHSGAVYRASHKSASDLGTIAKISTVGPETSQNTRTSPTRSLYCCRGTPRNRLMRLTDLADGELRCHTLTPANAGAHG